MTNENPYESPVEQSLDGSRRTVQLPLTETVVFDLPLWILYYKEGERSWLLSLLRIVGGVVGAVGLLASVVLLWGVTTRFYFEMLVVSAIFAIPSTFLIAWAIWRNHFLAWRLRRSLVGQESQTVEYTLSVDCLTIETGGETHHTVWSAFATIEDTNEFVVLRMNDGHGQLFPIRRLTPEFIDTLFQLFEARTADH